MYIPKRKVRKLFRRVGYSTKTGGEAFAIWYAVYCPTVEEREAIDFCRYVLDKSVLKDAFVLHYEQMRRYRGEWHMERRPLFPGYIFLESEKGERLGTELENHRSEILAQCHICVISEPSEKFLGEICGTGRCMSFSRGVIHKGVTRVVEGPLKGREQMISRIDRHKRIAFLKNQFLEFLPNPHGMKVGMEITEKTGLGRKEKIQQANSG